MKASSIRDVELFWGIEGADNFAGTRRLAVPYTGNGDWQVVAFEVSAAPLWVNETATRLRLDPIRQAGATFAVDWIRAGGGDSDGDGRVAGFVEAEGVEVGVARGVGNDAEAGL
jgi:hypothetical protein